MSTHPAEHPLWDAGVVVSLAGDAITNLAISLASLTGREHVTVPSIEAVLDVDAVTTTFLATADTVNDHWLGAASERAGLGLLTARDHSRLAALVSRTLRAHDQLSTSSVHLEAITNAVARADLTSTTPHTGTLTLRAHGRECLVHLSDGVICGRSESEPSVRPDGRRMLGLTSCVQNEGCYRLHYGPDEVISAAEISAGIVLLDSCMVQKVGSSQFTSDTTLALTMLEGETFAVVASPWVRGGYRVAGPLFTALLQDGMSLGRAVAVVNEEIDANTRAIGRFVLLGDASLRPFPSTRLTAADPRTPFFIEDNAIRPAPLDAPECLVVQGLADVVRLRDGQTLVLPRGGPAQVSTGLATEPLWDVMRRLAARARAVARLWAYDLVGPDLDPGRARAALAEAYSELADTLVSETAAAALDRAEKLLDAADRTVAAQLTDLTVSSRYHFMDSYSDSCERVEKRPARCPECNDSAVLIRWRHVLDADVERLMLLCAVCGEVTDEDADAVVTCRLVGVQHTARTQHLKQQAVLHNRTGRTVRAHLGYALLYEELYGTEWARTELLTLAPHEVRIVEVGGHIPADFDVADRHGLRLFAVAEGRISAYSRYLWVAASPAILDSSYMTTGVR
ncbi:hypothetical protein Q0Z83_054150 [Actinoplanes sichuanensis]|uniref:Uncharacterized protein n=1 Tax=Actinoplanes sichuanensis TaxID=512349 RepID=A0ABW4AU01_9ACTN|nr:hypothetical protein [Actinoplanes sichuanensis]BEL07224.1 hypothetical protein Q0Z83_054150 [Actinoplanes sichuanensis]